MTNPKVEEDWIKFLIKKMSRDEIEKKSNKKKIWNKTNNNKKNKFQIWHKK